nr:hypothetical protein [Tanacetum cinerariifolium]
MQLEDSTLLVHLVCHIHGFRGCRVWSGKSSSSRYGMNGMGIGTNLVETMEAPMTIDVTSCWVSRYKDLQLSDSTATHYYFNLDILEVERSQDDYEATITNVNKMRDWYYISCTKCTRKVKENGGAWERIMGLNKNLPTDETCITLFTFFTPIADAFTHRKCPEVVRKLGIRNPQ